MLKDTLEGHNPIIDPEVDETEENEGEAERGLLPKWPTFEKGIGAEGSGGYKLEFLVLHDQKVIVCCPIYIIPCATRLPCCIFLYR